jgi:hypothetical protein
MMSGVFMQPLWEVNNWADDNARVVLASLLTHSIVTQAPFSIDTSAYDRLIIDSILGNLRITSQDGFRPGCVAYSYVEAEGWQWFANSGLTITNTTNAEPHYLAQLWAMYLLAYGQTQYTPLYDSALAAM